MMAEIDEQLPENIKPDVVVTPVGVGSLAQSVVSHFKRSGTSTIILAVEPDTAACFYQSTQQGDIVPIHTSPTIMSGLDCGNRVNNRLVTAQIRNGRHPYHLRL